MRGYLDRGDTIRVVFGDTSAGSPGWQLPTFCEETFEFKTLVDPIATFQFKELPESPTLAIVPGPPARAICIAPSRVAAGQPFTWRLKLEDRWGNPVAAPAAHQHAGFAEPGIQRLTDTDPDTGLTAESNPIDVVPKPTKGLFWGDLHGQSEETIGTNSIVDYFAFARDRGLVDVAAHQGNDFQITDAFWETINATTRDFNEPGRFVTFPGYEWSGNTPLGGDRNIYFSREGGRIFRSCFDLLPGQTSTHPQAPDAGNLFARLRETTQPRAFAYAHVGGRYADLRLHDPAIELAAEVHSAWGTFEWLVEDAFRLGYRIAIVANSDGHKGRPGASYPGASRFGSLGGLTCFVADRLDRESILEALTTRRCYATTGHRPLLDVSVITRDGREAPMGGELDAKGEPVTLKLRAVGTGPIEAIQVRNGPALIETARPYGTSDLGRRLKVAWCGAEVRGRARQVAWDGCLHVDENIIEDAQPLNFWNPDRQPRRLSDSRIEWQSITTGGCAGLLLTLRQATAGRIHVLTSQGNLTCDLHDLGLDPRISELGGVGKQLRLQRLPDTLPREIQLTLSLPDLRAGDNPIYVRVDQQDGHHAWSSPVYVTR